MLCGCHPTFPSCRTRCQAVHLVQAFAFACSIWWCWQVTAPCNVLLLAVETLQSQAAGHLQAGYLMCEAENPALAPLHCVVRIVPAQVLLDPALAGTIVCKLTQWQICCMQRHDVISQWSFVCFFQVNSEFQSFKHVEILGPGEHMRSQQPLEATLAIHPTVVLTNALPYPMHLILWQVSCLAAVHASGACSSC